MILNTIDMYRFHFDTFNTSSWDTIIQGTSFLIRVLSLFSSSNNNYSWLDEKFNHILVYRITIVYWQFWHIMECLLQCQRKSYVPTTNFRTSLVKCWPFKYWWSALFSKAYKKFGIRSWWRSCVCARACVCVWGGACGCARACAHARTYVCTYTVCQERTLCMFCTCEVRTFDKGRTHSRSAVGFTKKKLYLFLSSDPPPFPQKWWHPPKIIFRLYFGKYCFFRKSC